MTRWTLVALMLAACSKQPAPETATPTEAPSEAVPVPVPAPDSTPAPDAAPVAVQPTTAVPAAPAPADRTRPAVPSAKPSGAPTTVTAEIGATKSTVAVRFDRPGTAVKVEIWGATGLTVPADKLVWEGEITEPGSKSFTVEHTGAGDLAIGVTGTFSDTPGTKVQSFTVGDRKPQ